MLAFTVFPLGYSLYIAFLKIESKTEITRERVPMFNEAGEPIMLANGKQRMKTIIHKNQINTTTFLAHELPPHLQRPPGRDVGPDHPDVHFSTVSIELVLGFLLAVLFNGISRGAPPMRAVMILPIFATPLAAGYLFFTILYEEGGPLGFLGFPFLSDPDWALASVIFVDIWQWTPFCFLVFLAALQSVPDELYEAAVVDGANGWQDSAEGPAADPPEHDRPRPAAQARGGPQGLRHPLRADGRGAGHRDPVVLVPRLPDRDPLLRPRLRERALLRAPHHRHDHHHADLPAPPRELWLRSPHDTPGNAGSASRSCGWSRSA